MHWPTLTEGRLIRRYKRFLADVDLGTPGGRVTAHCPNTGSMLGCDQPDRPVFLSYHPSPKRKLKWSWELIDMGTSLVGINTQNTNRIVAEALHSGCIREWKRYDTISSEVKLDPATRLDFLLAGSGHPPVYMEVKNCTLVQDGVAAFPDAVTVRGQKHLHALCSLQENGVQGALFFLVQRTDAAGFRPADWIDPEYGKLLRRARDLGVSIQAYDVLLDTRQVAVHKPLPLLLD